MELSAFQIRKPFTVAIKGLLILKEEYTAYHTVIFIKDIYLNTGLITTREQIILFVFTELSYRRDFLTLKKLLKSKIEAEFHLLQNFKDDLLHLLSAF